MGVIPAQTVKFVYSSNKNDRNDAFCIWQAMHLPDIKTVKIQDESNQLLMSLQRLRNLIIKQKTQLQNNLRGCLYELGIICNGGCRRDLHRKRKNGGIATICGKIPSILEKKRVFRVQNRKISPVGANEYTRWWLSKN